MVGHSVGGWAALCLAGAVPYGRDGIPLDVPREPRVGRLVMYAPATGWFAAPGALDAVTTPMLVFAGDLDTVTPVRQAVLLKQAAAPVDVRVVPGADHFSFMNARPARPTRLASTVKRIFGTWRRQPWNSSSTADLRHRAAEPDLEHQLPSCN